MMATTMMAMVAQSASWSQASCAHHRGPFAKPVFAVMVFQECSCWVPVSLNGDAFRTIPVFAAPHE